MPREGTSGVRAREQRRHFDVRSTAHAGDRAYLITAASLLLVTAAIFLFVPPAAHDYEFDFWEHVASIKQLMIDPVHPLHPQYASHDKSRQYMPWYLLLALLGRAVGCSPLTVLAVGSILTTALLLVSIRLFFGEYFADTRAPLVAVLVLFFAWGRPWIWSSFYNLRSYLMTAAYPSTFVLALTFLLWWLGIRAVRRRSVLSIDVAAVVAISALAVLVHQLSAFFAVAGFCCFVVAEERRRWPQKAAMLAAVFVGLAVSSFWPYFDPWMITNKTQLWNPLWNSVMADRFFDPGSVLLLVAPALPGLWGLWQFARRRQHLGSVLAFAGSTAAWAIGGALGNPIAHRVLIVPVLFLHIGLVWVLLHVWDRGGVPARLARAAMAMLIVFHLGLNAAEIGSMVAPNSFLKRLPMRHHVDAVSQFRGLVPYIAADAVVMASPWTAEVLPAFTGRIVSVYRASPFVPDDREREADCRRFFDPATPDAERLAIAARRGVSRIVFFQWEPVVEKDLERIAIEIGRSGPLVVMEIPRGTPPT